MRCVTPDWAIKWAIKMKGEPTRKCGPTLPNRKTSGGKTNQNGYVYIYTAGLKVCGFGKQESGLNFGKKHSKTASF